jgi:WD40 repeat protein
MKGFQKNFILIIILSVSISFLIACVSASDPSTINTNYVFTSYSSDNLYAVKSTSDNNIYFFDNSNNKNSVPWTYNVGSYIGSLAISPDGKYVTVGSGSGLIYLFDQNGNLLWKKSFGDALIDSISFSSDSNYLDASNALNEAFYIDLNGNLANRPATTEVVPSPSEPLSSISPSLTSSDNNPGTIDTSGDSWNNYLAWGIFILIILLFFSAIFTSRRRKKPATVKKPSTPQTGIIYAESIPHGAAIYFNGTYVGISPITIPNVWLGGHTLKATLNGYDSDTQRIYVNPGQTVHYSPNLRKIQPSTPPKPVLPKSKRKLPLQDLIAQLASKAQEDREDAQRQLIILVNTDGKTAVQQIIKELEKQPSGVKREIVNMLYYLSKESQTGQLVTEELINALTYSSSDVKWLIIQTLGRLKDKRALHALEFAVSDTDFLVKYWAIVSLKSIQES